MPLEPTPEDWQRREERLDALLALPADERAARLDALTAEAPEDAAALRAWLSGIERSAGYLGEMASRDALQVGPWRALRLLGRGGMGEVWLGERADGLFARQVAIKFLRDDRPELRTSLETERRVLAGLQHPGIVRLLDAGIGADGHPFLVTDFIDGATLDAWLGHERPALAPRIALLRQVAEAVAYAHERMVVHRDIKPANVLVDGAGRAHLLDFGIARVLAGDGEASAVTHLALTPDYAAPEVIAQNIAGVRSDVYALGGVLYFLLTGRPPLQLRGLPLAGMVQAIGTQDPAPIGALAGVSRRYAADLEAIALKALAKDPQRRYGSVEAMLRDLDAARDDRPLQARAPHAWERASRYVRRHRIALGVASLLLGSLLAGLVGTLWQAREATLQRDRAEREAARAVAEAKASTAVRDFLVGVFKSANPEESGGKMPTALELIDVGLRRVDGELREQPQLQIPLLAALGETYKGLGQVDRSIDTLRRVRDLAVATQGADSLAAMRTTVQLAAAITAHRKEGAQRLRDEIAPPLKALIDGGMPAADIRLRVAALTQYGSLLEGQGEAAAAEANLRRAVELGRAADAPAETADALVALQAVLVQKGLVRDAVALLREALAIRVESDGVHSVAVATIRASIGFLLVDIGNLDEASDMLAQALQTRRDVYGERHPKYAHGLIELASVRERQGQYDEAERLLQQAIGIARQALGDDSDLALSALNSLAGVRSDLGDLAGAIGHSRAAVAMAVRMYSAEHDVSLNLRDNLVGMEAMYGDYAQAVADARGLIAARERSGSSNTGYARFWLGYALRLAGDAAAAKIAHEQALATLLATQGDASNFAITVRAALAEDERDLGAFDAARAQAVLARDSAVQAGDETAARSARYLLAQLDVLQQRSTTETAAVLDDALQRARQRKSTPMTGWQLAEAGLFAALWFDGRRPQLEVAQRAQAIEHANTLSASPLADPFVRRLAATKSEALRRSMSH